MRKPKIPLIRKIFSDSQYDWMVKNLPFYLMYSNRWIDSQHKMWMPRWGWSKKQIEEAMKKVDEKWKNIKWE